MYTKILCHAMQASYQHWPSNTSSTFTAGQYTVHLVDSEETEEEDGCEGEGEGREGEEDGDGTEVQSVGRALRAEHCVVSE